MNYSVQPTQNVADAVRPSRTQDTAHALFSFTRNLRNVWLGLAIVALGGLLGFLVTSPLMDLTLSVSSILFLLVAIFTNPLLGLLMWVVSSPFGELYISIPLGAGFPDLSLGRFCVAFVLTLLLAQAAIRRRKLAPLTDTDWVAILFLMGLGFSILNDYSNWQSVIQAIFDRYYVSLLAYYFAKNLVTQRRDVDKVLVAVLIFGVYAGLYAIYENRTENILFTNEEITFTRYQESGLHVLRGLLRRSDHFGALFSMVIPVSFYLYFQARAAGKKGLYAVALGILFVGLFVTYKRTAWLAVLVTFFVIQLFHARFRRFFLVMLVVVAILLVATWDTISQSNLVTARIQSKYSTVEGRTSAWGTALQLWAEQPIFGLGFGNYEAIAARKGAEDTALENEHLSILFGAGLLGFVPYVAWFAFLLRDSIRLYRDGGRAQGERQPIDRELIVIFWGILLGYLINYMTTTISGANSVPTVFCLLAGTIVGSQSQSRASAHARARQVVPQTLHHSNTIRG